uniref:Uncharacterized protein n=1 Tax=Panagrolaimus superbus TaxID=310955 RepID=A0A914Y9L1_9BILA
MHNFRCRGRNETYQDVARVKFQAYDIRQTSAIVFDEYYREMATCQGGNKNCINVWKYSAPSSDFSLVHEIECNSRPLNMVKSVCEEFIVVTNDAEEFSFYDLFKKDENIQQKNSSQRSRLKQLSRKFDRIRQNIR